MKHLSRFDIEAIADKYVQAYMALPDVRNTQIYRIDPELLLEKVLGLNVEYQHLSYDGSILGMTSFTEMGVQVFEDDDNEAFFFLDGKTVLVEKDLNFDSKLKGRKNFTLIPLWHKPNLSIEEAVAYSGIGRDKLYELTNPEDCPFVLWIGNRRMIKRKKFDEYIERQYSI